MIDVIDVIPAPLFFIKRTSKISFSHWGKDLLELVWGEGKVWWSTLGETTWSPKYWLIPAKMDYRPCNLGDLGDWIYIQILGPILGVTWALWGEWFIRQNCPKFYRSSWDNYRSSPVRLSTQVVHPMDRIFVHPSFMKSPAGGRSIGL